MELQQILVVCAEALLQGVEAKTKDSRVFPWIHWKAVLEIMNAEFAPFLIKREAQFSTIEDDPILVAENGDQHFALQFVFERIPVNIKEVRIGRRFPILQNIKPPGIIAAHNSHVVGNDVENLSHTMLMQGRNELVVLFESTDLRIQLMMVNDVVSMHAAGSGAQIRRGVTMRNTQLSEIGDELGGLQECEIAIELQAIRRNRYPRWIHVFRNHVAENGRACSKLGV